MSGTTGIEWTDATWNPIRGCSRVSEGCRNCYAEKVAYRFSGPGQPYEGLVQIGADGERRAQWNGQIKFVEEHLLDPLKWHPAWLYDPDGARIGTRSLRIFVNSMSDLFHENVTDEMLDRIFAVMALSPQHTFQVLTKRPERMLRYLAAHGRTSSVYNAATLLIGGDFARMSKQMAHHRSSGEGWWPLPNVWLGVSVENQAAADTRIPLLLQTPAAVRFLSVEPLLGPVQLTALPGLNDISRDVLAGKMFDDAYEVEYGGKLDWVIVGGESGPGARPMHPDWARSLRDQCTAAGVPFFFKQWGEWVGYIDRDVQDPDWRENYAKLKDSKTFEFLNLAGGRGFHGGGLYVMRRVGKKAAGRLLDGREWNEFPGAVRA